MRWLLAVAMALGLVACASAPKKSSPPVATATAPAAGRHHAPPKKVSPYAPAQEDPGTRGDYVAGGLYKPGVADTTPDHVPDVDAIPEPDVVDEPRSRAGNRSTYTVLGKQYRVLEEAGGYVEEGTASYYGQKFHGRRTSNLEVYDMYAFTAAHKSLPLPSFARVTNLDNGKSVVVRVNDRGPFHAGRIIDLSYAAAVKLGITQRGTGRVEVRALTPDGDTRLASAPSRGNRSSAMDRLVAAGGTEQRFDMRQDGKPMTANEFDAWMTSRRLTVATGKPRAVTTKSDGGTGTGAGKGGTEAVAAVSDVAAQATPAAATPAAPSPAQVAKAVAAAAPSTGTVTLQVASFATRGNADRALDLLRGAGIADARLHDGSASGRNVWRLRVGPLAASAASELSSRLVGLGFGQPQFVHD
ncbi:septal ring lytic transglycosylase RlpA family protein [Aerolutibacter ruishenii]|uniref:Endolytic peptidoglycan transglycosylase RlpA n=1 Tax=Aerolutibacter ruishenii TaxID=686800 RepID=A0A562M3P8_9GAMM|nr:septal ring lytic transglycosylase RlpA family protein [Lysobacter ruishenii]TWI14398.1 rare lipoprotein A [Lysobacter ruishenii]